MKSIKFIILYCIFFIIACRKIDTPIQIIETNKDIFSQSSAIVQNGQDIEFKLDSAGKYLLILVNSTNNNVISKEKFNGIQGNNIKKIYTNSFNQKSLYLYLVNENNQQIKKTLITVK